jgi:uncharacterized membrane protein
MRPKNLDLILAVSIASMNVVWAMLPNRTPLIGIMLALPLVFVLPGYTLSEALFHKRALQTSHRLIFSLGLSLALCVLSGFILNVLPGGLQAKSWAVLLGLLTTVFSLLVALLRRRVPLYTMHPVRFRLRIHEGVLLGLALIVVIQALFYSAVGAALQPHPGFTQLWMIPPTRGDKNCAVRLGVRSFESEAVRYRIQVTENQEAIASWPSIVLAPQQEWISRVPIITKTADKVYIEARLYSSDKPASVYQQVDFTLSREEFQCQAIT